MPVMKVGLACPGAAALKTTLKGRECVLRAAGRGVRAGRVCSMGGQYACCSRTTCAVNRRLSLGCPASASPAGRLSARARAGNRRSTACKRAAMRQASEQVQHTVWAHH
eukprot:4981035-Prymnesium_polylepis.1